MKKWLSVLVMLSALLIGHAEAQEVSKPTVSGEKEYSTYLTVCASGCASTVAANTTYNSSVIRLQDQGFNGARVRINYSGTSAGSADLQVFVYSSTDCSTKDTHQDDRGVVHTPRATVSGFAGYVTFFMAAPCAIIEVKTMPIIPQGNAAISIAAIRQFYSAPPANCMSPDMSFGFCWQGTAEFGRVQGAYTFTHILTGGTPANGNCTASIWNGSSSGGATPIRVVIRGIDFQSSWSSTTADVTATVRAIGLYKITADTALSASSAQPTDSVFLTALATYRSAAAGGACTTSGTPYTIFWLSQTNGPPARDGFPVPGESGKITLRPGEGLGVVVISTTVGNTSLTATHQAKVTFHIDEEP